MITSPKIYLLSAEFFRLNNIYELLCFYYYRLIEILSCVFSIKTSLFFHL